MQHTTPKSPNQEKKLTPGPWEPEKSGGRGLWIKGSNGEWAALACGDTDERAEANALAIAALPDLIEAADKAVRNWEVDENLDNLDHAMIALRDVLSRIQGGK